MDHRSQFLRRLSLSDQAAVGGTGAQVALDCLVHLASGRFVRLVVVAMWEEALEDHPVPQLLQVRRTSLANPRTTTQTTAARRMIIRTIMTRKMTIQTATITQTKIKILTIIQKTIRTTNQLTIQKMITLMMRTMKRSSPLRARSNPALRALLVRLCLCLHLYLHRPHRHHVRQVSPCLTVR